MTELTAEVARNLMYEFHDTREATLLAELEAKIEKAAKSGFRSIKDKPLKGYQSETHQLVAESLTKRGFQVSFAPFEDNPLEGVMVSVQW